MIEVQNGDEMDNLTFLKHMDKRHSEVVLNGPLAESRTPPYDSWVGPYRAFHDNLHNIAVPGQLDHEHLW